MNLMETNKTKIIPLLKLTSNIALINSFICEKITLIAGYSDPTVQDKQANSKVWSCKNFNGSAYKPAIGSFELQKQKSKPTSVWCG